jgi:hypothetical protein
MAVTIDSETQVATNAWEYVYSSDLGGTPTFYIYLNGSLIEVTTRTTKRIQIEADREFQLEILDNANTAPQTAYPDYAIITWEPVDNAIKYRIDQWVASAWVELATVADMGQNTFEYTTQKLADVTTHLFQITPIDSGGIEGAVRPFSVLMVRRPDRPVVTYVYDNGTNKITATVT